MKNGLMLAVAEKKPRHKTAAVVDVFEHSIPGEFPFDPTAVVLLFFGAVVERYKFRFF